MAGRLDGKVAIGTGGASGMGRDTVLRFLDEGARVMIADLNDANGAQTLAAITARGQGDRAGFVRANVASEADVAAMIRQTEERYLVGRPFFNSSVAQKQSPRPISERPWRDTTRRDHSFHGCVAEID